MADSWKTFKIDANQVEWVGTSASNFIGEDGVEYGQWSKTLRNDGHGLTILVKFKAPKGKAWRVTANAPELGEDVYVLEGAYYKRSGEVLAGAGEFMFNAPDALHGGIVFDVLILVHWCSGKRDYNKSLELIDFAYNA